MGVSDEEVVVEPLSETVSNPFSDLNEEIFPKVCNSSTTEIDSKAPSEALVEPHARRSLRVHRPRIVMATKPHVKCDLK